MGPVVFIGNLHRQVPEDDLRTVFEDCGEIVEIRLATNNVGQRRPFAHIVFGSVRAAKAAIRLTGTELGGEPLRVEPEESEKDEYSTMEPIVFIGNLHRQVPEDDLRTVFEDCGEIVEIRLATNDVGQRRPFAHIVFGSVRAAKAALRLTGTELGGEPLRVEPQESEEDEYSTKTVYLTNLPSPVTKKLLRPVFEVCGTIKDIRIGDGYAHVEYDDEESCAQSLDLDGTVIDDAEISVEKANLGRKRKRRRGRGRGL